MRLATSTFSFADEWLVGELTVSGLLDHVARAGAPEGVEVIGHQLWRTFPHLERGEIVAFRRLLEELELEPAAIGVYVDLLRRRDRPLTPEESLAELAVEIETASALGFPVARLHAGLPLEVIEGVATVAEERGVVVAIEVQGEQRPEDPGATSLLELLERMERPSLGLVLDFSVSMRRVPTTFIGAAVGAGVPADALEEAIALWEQGAPTRDVLRVLEESRAPEPALDLARSGLVRFGRQGPETWAPHVRHIAHVHAKVWELDEHGRDPAVRDTELIEVLQAGGYDGFICSEWGGHAWLHAGEVDASNVAAQHLAHLARLIEATSPVRA